MTLPRTVAAILRDHVRLEVEGIDRVYLNAVVPILQERGIAWFFRDCRLRASFRQLEAANDFLGRTGQTGLMKLDPILQIRRIQGF